MGKRALGLMMGAALGGWTASAAAQPEPPTEPPTPEQQPPDPVEPPAPPPEEPAGPAAPPAAPPAPEALATPPPPVDVQPPGRFSFGSYGRMIAATDFKGRSGRDADIVAYGSRLDEPNYVELELRRDDHWIMTGSSTALVATLAVGHPVFHYNGEFDASIAMRNLYLESRDLAADGLSVWAGSRMYRGDDIYLLDFWPLDNLNTLGGGARYDVTERTYFALQGGLSKPESGFFGQAVDRPSPLNQIGAASVNVLDRQKFIGSVKASHIVPMGEKAGLKGVAYAELHELPSGQREGDPGVFETLPADGGYVIGAQIGGFTGERDGHINLFLRYARGLAAYGDFATPTQLALDRTTAGAHEIRVALGGNWEYGPVGVMLGAYLRSFRNASPDLDFHDVDEGILAVRPHLFFGEVGGLAVEASYQAQQRGVLSTDVAEDGTLGPPEGPHAGRLVRFGFVPFLSPAGRGDYSRPQIRLIWAITLRDDGARRLYPQDDVFGLRKTEHFFGFGAEWWFNSSSYGG